MSVCFSHTHIYCTHTQPLSLMRSPSLSFSPSFPSRLIYIHGSSFSPASPFSSALSFSYLHHIPLSFPTLFVLLGSFITLNQQAYYILSNTHTHCLYEKKSQRSAVCRERVGGFARIYFTHLNDLFRLLTEFSYRS